MGAVTKMNFQKIGFFSSSILLTTILIFASLSVVNISLVQANPSYEDFTTYTEVDTGNDRIQKTTNHIDHKAYCSEDTYVYKDYGIDYFGDFEHLVDCQSDFAETNSKGIIWSLQNDVDDFWGIYQAGKTGINVHFSTGGDASQSLQLEECYSSNSYFSIKIGISASIWYYLRTKKIGTALTSRIWTNSTDRDNNDVGAGSYVIQLGLTLHADHTFRYVFACNTIRTAAPYYMNTDIENLDLQTEAEYECRVNSIPELNVEWELDSTPYYTPWNDNITEGSRTFEAMDFEVSVNSSYKYTFDHWSINGSGYYGSLSIDVEIGGETNLTMYYLGSSIEQPYYPTFAHDAISGTWYFRSDTHTIHEILAYRLDNVNSNTAIYDSRATSGSYNISYGIRVWILDSFGNNYELSGGTPEAIVTRSSNGEGIQSAYFECPAYAGLIDALQVNLYQRFNEEPWSLRRYFITDEDLYIKLPASSWTITYYTKRTTASTTAYFHHGSTSFNSRILFQYYKANPWELALARLQAQNYLGFMTTPWTYYLGDIFWSLLLLFGIVTMYNRVGSLKPILALLWILGGAGSVLSALIPALALHIAWLMLAVAMGITLFKLIYR